MQEPNHTMIPESKLIRTELTLRELALSEETKLTRKALIRWMALALGLMAPNESRKLRLDVLEALFYFHWARQNPTTVQLLEKMQELTGIARSNVSTYLGNLEKAGCISLKRKDGKDKYWSVDAKIKWIRLEYGDEKQKQILDF